MDYKQKYFKYKQKYLNLLKSQKGGQPFLMDILAGPVFSYLFERNQRLLQLIYTNRQPVMMQPLGNFTLNHRYRLQLLGRSSISVLLATRLAQGEIRNNRLELQLANRIISRTHKLPEISLPTSVTTLNRRNMGHSDKVWSVAFHPNLPFLASGSDDKTAKLWRLEHTPDGSVATWVATLDRSNEGHTDIVNSVAFHPNPTLHFFLASGSSDKTAKLWRLVHTTDEPAATCVATLTGHSDIVESVAFHPKAPLLATGSYDNTVKLWRFSAYGSAANNMQATCVVTLDLSNGGHSDWVNSVAFHPTLPFLASGSDDQTAKLWRLDSDGSVATCVATLEGHSSYVTSVAFHPTLLLLATGSYDETAKLWHFSANGSGATCVATLDRSNEGHSGVVRSVAFHPTAPLLATGSLDSTAKLWRLVYNPDGSILAGTCVTTLGSSKMGHIESVFSVAFHPKVPLLATGSEDTTVKLWRL